MTPEDAIGVESMTRQDELHERLALVDARIAAACAACGRSKDDVRLLVVTKTFPASDVAALARLGCAQVGESRDQEARAKREELGALADRVRWHMIGQVQRNKARSVAAWADVVESVDRLALAEVLSTGAQAAGRSMDVLIQVSLEESTHDQASRGGCPPDEVTELADRILGLPALRLAGVMAVAPHPGDPDRAFARLAEVHAMVLGIAPQASTVSAGMSADLEAAIAHGATQVRIGGAILGNRTVLR